MMTFVIFIIFLCQFVLSFAWRQYLDTPLLNYAGFLVVEHGMVPYRDIFETSMPGVFLFHSLLGKTLGFSDPAVRIADAFFLLTGMALVYLVLKPFSKIQGFFAAILAGLIYQSFGAKMALQRDYLGFLGILGCMAIFTNLPDDEEPGSWTPVAIGFLVGFASSFKPHQGIILPFLAYFYSQKYKKNLIKESVKILCGFLTSFSIPVIWIWHKGGLKSFLYIFFNYLPLHTQIGHDFTVVPWPGKLWYSLSGLIMLNDHLIFLLLTIATFAVCRSCFSNKFSTKFKFLFLSAAVYFFYTAITGQFWYYHWIPHLFSSAICISFLLSPACQHSKRTVVISILAIFLLLILQVGVSQEFQMQISGQELLPPLGGVPDQISAFLKNNLKPEDKVQALDWVNGAIHGMLEAKAVSATRFLYDYHFYHHISNPVIKKLREDFINSLRSSPPEYFIYVFLKSRVSGPDTTQEFPALGKLLFSNYSIVLKDERFAIFKRNN